MSSADSTNSARLSTFAVRVATVMERAAVLALGAFALVLTSRAGGDFAAVNGRLFGLLLVVSIALLVAARRKPAPLTVILFALSCGLSLLGDSAVGWLAAVSLGLAALAREEGPGRRDLIALAAAALVASVLTSTLAGVPWANQLLTRASLALTESFGAIRGLPMRLGPSASGLWPLAIVLAVVMALLASSRRSALRSLLAFAALAVGWLVFLLMVEGVSGGQPQSAHAIAGNQWLMGVLAIPAVWIAASASAGRGTGPPRVWLSAAMATVVVAIFATNLARPSPPQDERSILLLDEGFVDWKVPEHGRYGPFQTGLFGLLPDYLELAGFTPRREKGPVTSDLLAGTDALVVINPQKEWPADELGTIWRFVREGGALLVLGDHTDIVGTQDSLDQLLGPSGISFRFDSGFPTREGWWHGLSLLRHPALSAVRVADDVTVSVGATLDVAPPGYPVLLGRYGFSDLGNRLNEEGAYLGDYIYQRGEQLGDVILAAAARVGRGRVMVFGDTSPLQNGALAYSFDPLVAPLMHWLVDIEGDHPLGLRWGVLLAALAVVAILVLGRSPGSIAWLAAATLVALALASWMSRPGPAIPSGESIAWVNLSHNERVGQAANQDNGLGAAVTALQRSGYRPLIMRRFDEARLANGELFLTIAPVASFSRPEIDALERFALDGGLVLVAAGRTGSHGSAGLLARFGLEVTPSPLGPAPVVREDPALTANRPTFVEAWAIRALPGPVGSPDEVTFVAEGESRRGGFTNVFYQTEGFTIAGFRSVGQGGVILIGDSLFLGDGNLENLRYHRAGNLRFVQDILEASRFALGSEAE